MQKLSDTSLAVSKNLVMNKNQDSKGERYPSTGQSV